MAMIALNGVLKGMAEELWVLIWEVAGGGGVVRSVKEAEERRSVTAEVAVVGELEA